MSKAASSGTLLTSSVVHGAVALACLAAVVSAPQSETEVVVAADTSLGWAQHPILRPNLRPHEIDTPAPDLRSQPEPWELQKEVVASEDPDRPKLARQPESIAPALVTPATIKRVEVESESRVEPTPVAVEQPADYSSVGRSADPVPLSERNQKPEYPRVARQRGWEGKVVIRAEIDIQGQCVSAIVKVSSGYGVLDEAASKAVLAWAFEPARKNGFPSAGTADVCFKFRLEDK